MATLPTSKRIHYLRKKNRKLLDKLENHSSEIHSELKQLKESIRGQLRRSHNSAKDENHSAWAKRNGSKQVFDALCQSETVDDMNPSHKSSMISDEVAGKTNIIEESHENIKLSPKCRCAIKQSDDSFSQKIIEANRKILSSIDYSPKSVFLRRMKSKYLSQCYCGRSIDRKTKELNLNPESPESSISSQRVEEFLSSCKSSSPEKEVVSRKEGTDFERLKTFRYLNWTDCHAGNDGSFLDDDEEPKQKLAALSSNQNKWREKYRINERLFAEPSGLSCRNLVRCSQCLKSTKPCEFNTNEVVVSIPSSLLDISNSEAGGKSEKMTKRNSAMKALTKRPKPCNSMALRYQKGIT